jgi:hypothetical protein
MFPDMGIQAGEMMLRKLESTIPLKKQPSL